ncbi:MAG: AMP-binding protein [Candidatus Latescibacterota bacterium]
MQIEELCACGIEKNEAETLLPHIQTALALDPAQRFLHLTRTVLKPQHPFALHQLLYKMASEDGVVWAPQATDIERTHINEWIGELELSSYNELYAWSIRERAAFWTKTTQRLGIRFRKEAETSLDTSTRPETAQFFVGSELNIAESCFNADKNATAITYQCEDGKLQYMSYGELLRMTRQVAAGLVIMGIKAGDSVAVDMPMTAESVAIYLGIVWAGCCVVAIADSFATEEVATRLDIGKAKLVFTQDLIVRSKKELPLYERLVAAEAPRAVVLPGRGKELAIALRQGDISWTEFLGKEEIDAVVCGGQEHSNTLFSSGTTGTPKAIQWNHITPIKCAADGYFHQDIHPGEVVAWPTSLGWMMGPWLIYASLVNRATIALYYDAPTNPGFARFVQEAGVTMLGVVPSLVRQWRANGTLDGLDWTGIRAYSSTGECSNPDDMHWLMAQAAYKPVIEYCGGTELAGGYLIGTMLQAARPACFTTPTLGTDIAILNEWGGACNNGEVFLRPPSIGLSTELINGDHQAAYYGNTPQIGGQTLRRHGDQVERIGAGHYRVHGRVDDAMNLGGIKVSSAEIERVLNAIEGVEETAAIAVAPSSGGPSQLVVYAVLAHAIEDLPAILQETIRRQLNPLFKIKDVVLAESLPRTASNKVMRRVLRDQYAQRPA